MEWIEISDDSLLGIKITEQKFVPLLELLCGLSVIAHVVQWYSDYLSFVGWNVTGKMPGGSRYGAPSETKLRDLADAINVLPLPEARKDIVTLSERLEKVEDQIDGLRWSMKSFDLFAKFCVFGWHLALPLGAAFVAFNLERHA